MKYLFILLCLISCSKTKLIPKYSGEVSCSKTKLIPKYSGEDCVLIADPFYTNYQNRGVVFKIQSYQHYSMDDEITYHGCFEPFFDGPGCSHFLESEIQQTVMCPNG